jgi:hypothetical protein
MTHVDSVSGVSGFECSWDIGRWRWVGIAAVDDLDLCTANVKLGSILAKRHIRERNQFKHTWGAAPGL